MAKKKKITRLIVYHRVGVYRRLADGRSVVKQKL